MAKVVQAAIIFENLLSKLYIPKSSVVLERDPL